MRRGRLRHCPQISGGKPAAQQSADEPPTPAPPPDDANKVARLYMRHRLDLGLALASDEWIIEHVDDLTMTLWNLSQHAIDHNDWPWLTRHYWWLQAATRLNRGEASAPLDG